MVVLALLLFLCQLRSLVLFRAARCLHGNLGLELAIRAAQANLSLFDLVEVSIEECHLYDTCFSTVFGESTGKDLALDILIVGT